ncbi:MAG: PHP domain-containing protein [Nanoarchaeota archaeon]|nr:PHP domain-containing protein [Nanoarchaeota archaeon]
MRLVCDLHLHSRHSYDCKADVRAILATAISKKIDVLSITDHNSLAGSVEAMQLVKKEKLPILLIPGQEVKTKQGELLVYGIREQLQPKQDVIATVKRAKELGATIIAPHPFDWLRSGVGKALPSVLPYLDAIEGFNAKTIFNGMDSKAQEAAKKHHLPTISSSDAHLISEIGTCATIVDASAKTEAAVLKAICAGKITEIRQRISFSQRLKSTFQKV